MKFIPYFCVRNIRSYKKKISKVSRLFILILSIMMLFTSSCTMKRLLWDYMGVEKAIATKALLPSEGRGSALSVAELCAVEAGSFLDEAEELIPSVPVKAPMLLLFALLILPWVMSRVLLQRKPSFSGFKYSFPQPVPIYLKLGQLIYYS